MSNSSKPSIKFIINNIAKFNKLNTTICFDKATLNKRHKIRPIYPCASPIEYKKSAPLSAKIGRINLTPQSDNKQYLTKKACIATPKKGSIQAT